MTTYAAIRSTSSTMQPATPPAVSAGSIFIDSTNSNALSFKNMSGVVSVIGETTSADILIKLKKNQTVGDIPANKEVALKPDGSIALADNDGINLQVVMGVTQELIASGAFGRVLMYGPNATGAVTGLGFTTGDTVMLSNVPGVLTNSLIGMDPEINTIMKVGIADCATGVCSGTATDLIMVTEVMSRPGGGL